MDAAARATLVAGRGIAGNANQGGSRQVTVIEREVFDRLQDQLASDLDPAMRRANLMVSGVGLRGSRHQLLRIGDECRVELLGETRPCERMDEALPGLRGALEPAWSGGAYGRVVQGGEIRVGDRVWLEAPTEAAERAGAPEPAP
jgi:MOSC domain-containing protein YiiM